MMIETKLFEIRDDCTFIPAIATFVRASEADDDGDANRALMRRAGYDSTTGAVLLTCLDGGRKAQSDAYEWGDRTFQTAHLYIEANWDKLESGAVVDVAFILGETEKPKTSERFAR